MLWLWTIWTSGTRIWMLYTLHYSSKSIWESQKSTQVAEIHQRMRIWLHSWARSKALECRVGCKLLVINRMLSKLIDLELLKVWIKHLQQANRQMQKRTLLHTRSLVKHQSLLDQSGRRLQVVDISYLSLCQSQELTSSAIWCSTQLLKNSETTKTMAAQTKHMRLAKWENTSIGV